MGDRNIIQLKSRDVWHYWNFDSMMPICGAGVENEKTPGIPHFVSSRHACATGLVRKICHACWAAEIGDVGHALRPAQPNLL